MRPETMGRRLDRMELQVQVASGILLQNPGAAHAFRRTFRGPS